MIGSSSRGIIAAVVLTSTAAAVTVVTDNVPDGSTLEVQHRDLADEAALMPSAEEVRRVKASWGGKLAASSPEVWDAALLASSEEQSRRRLQDGELTWKYDYSVLTGAHRAWNAPLPGHLDDSIAPDVDILTCTDTLASNAGEVGPCHYSCTDLTAHYYPGEAAASVRCFVYDRGVGAWPDSLMSMRRDRLDWHTWLERTDLPAGESATFSVGAGPQCVNVTVQTVAQLTVAPGAASSTSNTTETRCLLPGRHEHQHIDAAGAHTVDVVGFTVEVVGYTPETFHADLEGATEFIVGDCTDTLFRIFTTSSTAEVTWALDDDGHNGPWTFTSPVSSPGDQGIFEHLTCMFDNNFTLSHTGGNWVGAVEVVSYEPDKTIVIPLDESWIIQGTELNGIPVRLDARLESGTTMDRPGATTCTISRANLVLRHVRFSNQQATKDLYPAGRTFSVVADTALGGALMYTGGWGSKLIFEHCVFDHMYATSGAALFIDGQMDERSRQTSPCYDPSRQGEEDAKTTITITNCLYWELENAWASSNRLVDINPANLTVTNTQFLDNYALVSSGINFCWYGNTFDDGAGIIGQTDITFSRTEVANLRGLDAPARDDRYELSPLCVAIYNGHWPTGPGTERPDVATHMTVDHLSCHDYFDWRTPCLMTFTYGGCNAGCTDIAIADSVIRDAFAMQGWDSGGSGVFFLWQDVSTIVRTSFENAGIHDSAETNICEGGAIYLGADILGRLEDVSITNSRAAFGAAVMFFGTAHFEIVNSFFQGNVALDKGGAVFHKGPGPLEVEATTFHMNHVKREIPIPVTIIVHVYTGATGNGSELLPVWKLDGDNPSPSDGSCGNETVYGGEEYDIQTMYAKVLTTTSGPHRLWHGMIVNTAATHESWAGGGWIDVMDVLTRKGVEVCDNRLKASCPCNDDSLGRCTGNALEPRIDGGCYQGSTVGGEDDRNIVYCPSGQTFWSYTDIEVPQGHGGAIAAIGTGAVVITGSEFSTNTAGYGNTLSISRSSSFNVANTRFQDVTSSTIYTEGVADYDCATFPCEPGQSCSVSQLSLSCEACPSGMISTDGVTCTACALTELGTEPNADRTECVPCPEGMYSSTGICSPCDPGMVSSADRITCTACPAGTAAGLTTACEQCAPNMISAGAQLFCEECPGGKTTSDFIGCTDCPDGFVRRIGEDACAPCSNGMEPNDAKEVCIPCAQEGHFSNGRVCMACTAGKQPFANRTGCVPCPIGTAGIEGHCETCEAGRSAAVGSPSCQPCVPGTVSGPGQACVPCEPGFQPSESQDSCMSCATILNTYSNDGIECRECPARQQPATGLASCNCRPDTYNTPKFGRVHCYGANGNMENVDMNDECSACPDCLDCTVSGATRLKPGWAFYGLGEAFRCPGKAEVADVACVGPMLMNRSISERAWAITESGSFTDEVIDGQCSAAYAGPVCGNCAESYHHLKVGKACTACDQGTVDIPMLIGFLFASIVAGGIVITGAYGILVDHGIITDLRLLLGFYQLLGQMDNVLSITFPSPVPELLEIIGFLFLDVRKFIKVDCWDIGGFYGKLTTNVFAMPALCVGLCVLYYLNQRRTIGAVIAAGGSDESAYRTATVGFQQNMFLSIFLLYPMITTTLFRVPQCQSLGPSAAYHEDDYTVSCTSSGFYAAVTFSVVMIFLIPIGVPLVFLMLMYRAKSSLPDGRPNSTMLGGAKLCSNELDDDQDRYGFLCRDLKPEYWYYEIVTYSRKLTLGGLSVFMGRGTMAQAYFVATVEAFFLMHHMRTYPYVRKQHNQVDAFGHAALVLTYTITLILRNGEDAFLLESFPREGYGVFIVFIYAVVLPLPTFINFWMDANTKEDAPKAATDFGDTSHAFSNPLSGDVEGTDAIYTDSGSPGASDVLGGATASTSGAMLSRMAKVKREKQAFQAQAKDAQTELLMLRKEMASLQQQQEGQQDLASQQVPGDAEEAITAITEPQLPPAPTTPAQAQEYSMKKVIDDESLSEETRQAAQEKLEGLVSTQLLQSQLMTDAITAEKKAEAQHHERSIALKSLVADAQYSSQYLATLQQNQAPRQTLVEWLHSNRLMHHEQTILDVAGEHTALEDFEFLNEDDLAEITAKMTRVEGLRFSAALNKVVTTGTSE